MVYGSRFTGTPRRVLYFWHHVANKLLTLVSNMVTNMNLTDMETGYKVFRADIIKSIPIRSNRFGVEPEVTAKLAKVRARIFEVPISYSGRAYWEGKKIRWRDGLIAPGRSSGTRSSTTRRTLTPATRPCSACPGPSDTTSGCSSS